VREDAEPGSDLGWMALQARTLFACDANGRILARREPAVSRAPAPRFFLGRTAHGHLWRFRADLPAALVRDLARLAAAERAGRDLDLPPEREAALRERLEAFAPVEHVFAGPAFRFPDALPRDEDAGGGAARSVVITPSNAHALEGVFSWVRDELAERAPCLAIVEDGRAVAVCCCATLPGPDAQAVEASLGTLEGFRGRGLGARVTAAWARAVRERGLLPLFSSSFANRGALGVARRLRLVRYGSDLSLR
jgi:GNAT superfamily N-acetyltransferase